MTPAVLTPFRQGTADKIGPRLFRKQLLPVDKPIAYKGRTLKFDRPYLEQVAANFNAGAYDQVPAVLADDDNLHNENPENFRGQVKAVELNDAGLDVVVEMTDKGAELVADNPLLGVSARLMPDVTHGDGTTFENVLRHVCLTLKPKTNGSGVSAWETVSKESDRWGSQDLSQALDFSDATYPDEMADKTPALTDDHLEALKGLEGEARIAKARELLGEMTTESSTDKDDKGPKFSLKGLFGIKDDKLTDDDLHDAITKLESEDETVVKDDKVLATSLSDDDRKRIDLAEETARKADERVAAAEWKTERLERTQKGCPPAMLDLAEPLLKSGQQVVIDLSDDSKADASEIIRKLLTAAEGTVDLSAASGSSEETEGKFTDTDWEASV